MQFPSSLTLLPLPPTPPLRVIQPRARALLWMRFLANGEDVGLTAWTNQMTQKALVARRTLVHLPPLVPSCGFVLHPHNIKDPAVPR